MYLEMPALAFNPVVIHHKKNQGHMSGAEKGQDNQLRSRFRGKKGQLLQ